MPATSNRIYLGSNLVVGGLSDWVRNPAWPALTAPLATDQRIVGLYAVLPGDGTGNGGNFFAFSATGAYTINYGDGTTTNYTSGTRADYEYNYNAAALAGTNAPVTFTAATSTVNRTAHGLTNGSVVRFYDIVTTTGIAQGADYYVVNATANTFQFAATTSGSPVSFTNNGTGALLPYKVATVTITPQSGQNFASVNFQQKNGTTGLQAYATGWLDIAMALPQVTSLIIGGSTVFHAYVERINIVSVGAITSFSSFFLNCYSLESIPSLPSATGVTTMQSMFQNCHSLQTIPPFPGTVAAVTTMAGMFQVCYSLQTIPPFPGTVAAVTTTNNMFTGCGSLQTIPPMDLSGVTSGGLGFSGLTSLARIQATGMRFTFSVASCKLSAVALNELFTNLPTVTGQTVTVTGNYGINQAGYNPSIAQNKGWTVTA